MIGDMNRRAMWQIFDDLWPHDDVASVPELIDNGYVRHDPLFPSRHRGFSGFLDVHQRLAHAFAARRFIVEQLVSTGEIVAVRWSFTATHVGPLAGFLATNRSISVNGITIGRLLNGRLTEEWVQWDTLELLRQIGRADVAVSSIEPESPD